MANATYNTIAENPNSTVVAEYVPGIRAAARYQSENELELEFIRLLKANGHEYLNIRRNDDLLLNLRAQLSKLNGMAFSEAEWKQMLSNYLVNKNEGIEEKTTKIQEDHIFNLKRDNGSTKNVRILDKDNIHNNRVQLINQYESEGARKNRYDVTVLVNGLPMVHVELNANTIKGYPIPYRPSKNRLNDAHMKRILDCYASRKTHKYFSRLVGYKEIEDKNYNTSVGTYVDPEDTREVVDIKKLNAEIDQIVARQGELRSQIDAIVAELEGGAT